MKNVRRFLDDHDLDTLTSRAVVHECPSSDRLDVSRREHRMAKKTVKKAKGKKKKGGKKGKK